MPQLFACRRAAALALGGILTATALSYAAGPAPAMAAGDRIDTSRIVVAGGAITEILYELGVSDRIVAVDSTSQFPPDALGTKKSIGYFRALSTEGVLSMSPSVVIASDKAGPPDVVKALKASAVPFIEIDDRPEPGMLLARVSAVAAAVDRTEQGAALAARLRADFAQLEEQRRRIGTPVRALFILGVQSGRILVGGRNTAADAMFALAGARNVAAAIDGFKPMTEEMLIALDPEAIVTMTRSSGPSVQAELRSVQGVMASTAGRTARFIEMDALFLMGFGPRAPAAARELMERLHAGAAPKAATVR